LGHHGEREADDVDALFKQGVRHVAGEARVAQHHRDDRVTRAAEREAE